jgi:creatinine amidohydrolase
MTWKEIENGLKKTKTVIVPVSPLEEHGLHLPVSSDYLTAYEIAKRAAEHVNVFVFPPLILGVVKHGYFYPGTISVKQKTFENVLNDICTSLSDTGFKRIIFLSGHAGKNHLESIEKTSKGFGKIKVEFYTCSSLHKDATEKIIETKEDYHAGEKETSRILELAPEEVRKGKETKEFPIYPKKPKSIMEYKKANMSGVFGDATKATKEKGKILIDAAVKELVKIIGSD